MWPSRSQGRAEDSVNEAAMRPSVPMLPGTCLHAVES